MSVNPEHERRIAERAKEFGLTVSLSSAVPPEFREYQRASTTATNAALRPTVERYLGEREARLQHAVGAMLASPAGPAEPDRTRATQVSPLRIMQSGGGAGPRHEAVVSGPAGGVMGAAFIARCDRFASRQKDTRAARTTGNVILQARAQRLDGPPRSRRRPGVI